MFPRKTEISSSKAFGTYLSLRNYCLESGKRETDKIIHRSLCIFIFNKLNPKMEYIWVSHGRIVHEINGYLSSPRPAQERLFWDNLLNGKTSVPAAVGGNEGQGITK